MGARSDIQAALAEAMNGPLADTVEDFVASRVTASGEYDPVAGEYPTATTEFTGRWIRDEWSQEEADGQHILITDIKRVVLQNETEWVPSPDDQVNGMVVIDAQQDGALATWTVQLRRS